MVRSTQYTNESNPSLIVEKSRHESFSNNNNNNVNSPSFGVSVQYLSILKDIDSLQLCEITKPTISLPQYIGTMNRKE